MKVLFDHHFPFALAHGGFQILIQKLKEGLEEHGVEVEYLRWWDETQSADLTQFFGRPPAGHIDFAHGKGMRYSMMELMTGQGSRAKWKLHLQGLLTSGLKRALPSTFQAPFGWESYAKADLIFSSTEWEADVMQILFAADRSKIQLLPNGVDPLFFQTAGEQKNRRERISNAKWMVCLATITERKRVVETCEAAIAAKTPLWIIGKPYADDDYSRRFLELVEKSHGLIRYDGPIPHPKDLAPVLKSARGFVLLSTMETQSVAASAAAAAGCPLFLSDLPWARCSFGDNATYCQISSTEETAREIQTFYQASPDLPAPPKQLTWSQVGLMLAQVYQKCLDGRLSESRATFL